VPLIGVSAAIATTTAIIVDDIATLSVTVPLSPGAKVEVPLLVVVVSTKLAAPVLAITDTGMRYDPDQQRKRCQLAFHNASSVVVPAAPVVLSPPMPRFHIPCPPGFGVRDTLLRTGSSFSKYYALVMCWYGKASQAEAAYRLPVACPRAQDYMYDFDTWVIEIGLWWESVIGSTSRSV